MYFVLRPSSGVSCWTWEPTQNFEPCPLFNPEEGSLSLIPFIHVWVQVLSIPVLLLTCDQDWICNLQVIVTEKLMEPTSIIVRLCVIQDNSKWSLGFINLMFLLDFFFYFFLPELIWYILTNLLVPILYSSLHSVYSTDHFSPTCVLIP